MITLRVRSTKLCLQFMAVFKDGISILRKDSVHVTGVSWKQALQEADVSTIFGQHNRYILAVSGLVKWNGCNGTQI